MYSMYTFSSSVIPCEAPVLLNKSGGGGGLSYIGMQA